MPRHVRIRRDCQSRRFGRCGRDFVPNVTDERPRLDGQAEDSAIESSRPGRPRSAAGAESRGEPPVADASRSQKGRAMHLPGFRSTDRVRTPPPGAAAGAASASRLAVERLEGRTPDGRLVGRPPALADRPVGGPAVDAATAAAQLTPAEVNTLLAAGDRRRPHNNAIIAVVDRGGRVLGVRVDNGVSPAITGNAGNLVFAVDGALAEARTGAFFASDQAPLTSRTIENLSQSTMTQREIQSNPSITDPNSTTPRARLRRPGRHQGPLPARHPVHAAGRPLRTSRPPTATASATPSPTACPRARPTTSPCPAGSTSPGRHPGEHRRLGHRADPAGVVRLHLGPRARRPGPRDRHPARRHPDRPDR